MFTQKKHRRLLKQWGCLLVILCLIAASSARAENWLSIDTSGPRFGGNAWFSKTVFRIESALSSWGYLESDTNLLGRDLGVLYFVSQNHQPGGIGIVYDSESRAPYAIYLDYSRSSSTYFAIYASLFQADPEPEYILNTDNDALRFTVGSYMYTLVATGYDTGTPLMYAQLGRTPYRLYIVKESRRRDLSDALLALQEALDTQEEP